MDKPVKKTFALYDAGGDLEKNWFVYFYRQGKRIRKYGTINQQQTIEGRRDAAAALLAEFEKNYIPPPPNEAQRSDLYAALEAHRPTIRKKTFQTYRTKINNLFTWLEGRTVTTANLKLYFQEAAKTQHPTTLHDTYRMLFRLFKLAGLEHLLKPITIKKGIATPLRYFQPHQAGQLAAHLAEVDPQLWLWCQFVFYCFIRPRSELRFLKVGDIYFEERKILVRGEISKNGKTQYVAIPDAFFPALEPLKTLAPGAWVFPGRRGNPIGRNTYGKHHQNILRALGYGPEYAVYSWKHTGAVMAVKAGIGLKELQMQLRHHSLDQVNAYLRQLNVSDCDNLRSLFPAI